MASRSLRLVVGPAATFAGMIDLRVADKQADNTSRGGFRAFYEWLTGATSPHLPSDVPSAPTGEILPPRIGRYAIERKLGEDRHMDHHLRQFGA